MTARPRGSVLAQCGLALALVGAGLVAGGCGADDPTEDVPALVDRLDAVDAAIADRDYGAAREAIADLVDEAAQARDEGQIDDEQAEVIIAAAEELEDELPTDREPAPPADDDPSTTPAEPTTDDAEPDDVGNEGKKDGKGKNGGKGKKGGKGKGSKKR